MSPERLAELRKLAEAATPGPWTTGYWSGRCTLDHGKGTGGRGGRVCRYEYTISEPDGDYGGRFVSAPGHVEISGSNDYGPILSRANARFIATARTAVPELLDEVERLRTILADAGWTAERLEEVNRSHEADFAHSMLAEVDALKATAEALGAKALRHQREAEEARAEVERLRGALAGLVASWVSSDPEVLERALTAARAALGDDR